MKPKQPGLSRDSKNGKGNHKQQTVEPIQNALSRQKVAVIFDSGNSLQGGKCQVPDLGDSRPNKQIQNKELHPHRPGTAGRP